MDREVALEVSGLRKSFVNNEVLKGLEFKVFQGEFFGLAGINGAGKSTFLKCMLDFCHYKSGEVLLFGKSTRNAEVRSRISFLPEKFIPPYYLTGREFITMMMQLQSLPYVEEKVLEMLDLLALERSSLMMPVRSYSKGMTQKLGLASCFLAERDFYILDEPMSGLDPKARALVKRQFRKIKERGATLLFTSHALADIDEICERLVVLDNGVAKFEGTPQEMLTRFTGSATLEEAYLQCISVEEEAVEAVATQGD